MNNTLFSKEKSSYLAFGLLMIYGVVVRLNSALSQIFSYETQTFTIAYWCVMLFLFGYGIVTDFHRQQFARICLFIFCALIFFLFQSLIDTRCTEFTTDNFFKDISSAQITCASTGLIYMLLVCCLTDYYELFYVSLVFSRIGVIIALIADALVIYLGIKVSDDMNFSYNINTFATFLLVSLFIQGKKKDIVLLVICLLMLMVSGTRGPIVTVILAFALSILCMSDIKTSVKNIALLSSIVLVLVNVFVNFSELDLGFNIRLLEYQKDDMLLDSSGRDETYESTLRQIKGNPFFGAGIGSNSFINGSYSHNIFIDFLFQYGIFVGLMFSIALLFSTYKRVTSIDRYTKAFFIAFSTAVIGRLLFSGSYIDSSSFYVLISLLITSKLNIQHEYNC